MTKYLAGLVFDCTSPSPSHHIFLYSTPLVLESPPPRTLHMLPQTRQNVALMMLIIRHGGACLACLSSPLKLTLAGRLLRGLLTSGSDAVGTAVLCLVILLLACVDQDARCYPVSICSTASPTSIAIYAVENSRGRALPSFLHATSVVRIPLLSFRPAACRRRRPSCLRVPFRRRPALRVPFCRRPALRVPFCRRPALRVPSSRRPPPRMPIRRRPASALRVPSCRRPTPRVPSRRRPAPRVPIRRRPALRVPIRRRPVPCAPSRRRPVPCALLPPPTPHPCPRALGVPDPSPCSPGLPANARRWSRLDPNFEETFG